MSGIIQSQVDGGTVINYHYDEHSDTMHVERVQDVESLLDRNKALRAEGWDGYNADRSLRAVAEVPITLIETWKREGIELGNPDHDGELMKRLNDPVLRDLRIGEHKTPNGIIITGVR